ncbi:MAG: twin transmembrane helix small protein [Hyphomicrobium sp.]|nr:twin transmembrane helix small protein [Hyphomicrobium sp.]
METVLFHLTTVAVLAVLIVLSMGLWAMAQGQSANLSQRLMRWRVGLQFVAIVVIMAFTLIAKYQAG